MTDRTMAEVYRSYAAVEQGYAEDASLPNVKAIHTSAARRWIVLAERSERFTKPT